MEHSPPRETGEATAAPRTGIPTVQPRPPGALPAATR